VGFLALLAGYALWNEKPRSEARRSRDVARVHMKYCIVILKRTRLREQTQKRADSDKTRWKRS